MDQFILKLKNLDQRNMKIIRSLNKFFFVLTVFVFGLSIYNPGESMKTLSRISWISMLIGFLIIIIYLKKRYRDIGGINYNTTSKVFLDEIEKHYKFKNSSTGIIIGCFLLFLNIGIFMILYAKIVATGIDNLNEIIKVQGGLNLAFFVGGVIGYIYQSQINKAILDDVKKFKESLFINNLDRKDV